MDDHAVTPLSSVAPGWFPDPWGSAGQRWWDGGRWTDAVIPPRHRSSNTAVVWVVIVAGLALVGLSVFGMLDYMGFFDDPTLARVVRVERDGDVCVRPDQGLGVDCVPNDDGIQVGPGDCVLVYYGEGIRLDRRTECPQ